MNPSEQLQALIAEIDRQQKVLNAWEEENKKQNFQHDHLSAHDVACITEHQRNIVRELIGQKQIALRAKQRSERS